MLTKLLHMNALRNNIILVDEDVKPASEAHRYATSIELANLGFIVSPDSLSSSSVENLQEVLEAARELVGADRDMEPIYPGFPKQVQELSTMTLLFEQILHYWTAGAFLPNRPRNVRKGLSIQDMVRNARKIEVEPAFKGLAKFLINLSSAPVALSETDKEFLKAVVVNLRPPADVIQELAEKAINGENIQALAEGFHDSGRFDSRYVIETFADNVHNSDHLLRIILSTVTSPSDEKWEDNYDLAVKTLSDRHSRAVYMGRIPRGTRRIIVKRLGSLSEGFKADRLVSRRNLWRKILTAVHPYDFNLSEAEKRAVDIIHSNVEYRTLNSIIEKAMEDGDVVTASKVLADNQSGNLYRRVVALARLVKTDRDLEELSKAIETSGKKTTLTTLVSAYNGVLSANDENSRVTRVAGLRNTLMERTLAPKVDEDRLAKLVASMKVALKENLSQKASPKGIVPVVSDMNVPLVRRDASSNDRILDRGEEIELVGNGDILRIFGHWNNNQKDSGYMDIGVVVFNEAFERLSVSTWNSWNQARDWSTYSGDKLVYPGDSAAEYIDVNVEKLMKSYPDAVWAAMTVQSWSGWPMKNVDFVAGAMLRGDGDSGEVFDPRTLNTVFKPSTESTQSVPLAVNLKNMKMYWIDSSNGSTQSHISSNDDSTVGTIVYDELVRPRLTLGELATLWASAHGVETVNEPVNKDELLGLLD